MELIRGKILLLVLGMIVFVRLHTLCYLICYVCVWLTDLLRAIPSTGMDMLEMMDGVSGFRLQLMVA